MPRGIPAIAGIVLGGLALGVWLSASQGLRERLLEGDSTAQIVPGPLDCAPAALPCVVDLGDMQVELRFDRPPRPLEPFVSEIRLLGEDAAAARYVVLTFQMEDMDMGLNRFVLQRTAEHRWRGEITLPVCTTGRRDWIVDAAIDQGRQWIVRFGFALGSEESPPG